MQPVFILPLFQSISITLYSLLCCRRAQVAPEVWAPALAVLAVLGQGLNLSVTYIVITHLGFSIQIPF